MVDDVEDMNSLGFMEGKCTCKIVSTSTLKLAFERGNKKYKIGGAYISYLGIDV
jgi:hypothetical protein